MGVSTAAADEGVLLLMDQNRLKNVFLEHTGITVQVDEKATYDASGITEEAAPQRMTTESFGQALTSLGVVQSQREIAKLVERFDYDHDGQFDQHEFFAALRVRSEFEQFLAGLPLLTALARSLKRHKKNKDDESAADDASSTVAEDEDPIQALADMDRSDIEQAVHNITETFVEVLFRSSEKLRQYKKKKQHEKEAKQADENEDDEEEQKYCFKIMGGDLTDFNQGLSSRIGVPNMNVEIGMRREHCDVETSDDVFTTRNYDITTTARIEYNLAMTGGQHYVDLYNQMQDGGDKDKIDLQHLSSEERALVLEGGQPRNGHGPVRVFKTLEEYRQLDVVQTAQLADTEIVAIVLYTGPLYKPWNTTLRSGTGEYRTSVHVLSSAIKKIQQSGYKLRPGMVLYRGLSGGELPARIFSPDRDNKNQSGMTEFGIQSTTSDIQVALEYSGITRGFVSTVVETRISQVDSGAFISELSQYPYEKEFVYAPGSYLQAEGEGRMELTEYGLVRVIPMRINTSGRVQTVEEVMGERRTNILKTFELVSREIEYELRAFDGDSRILAMTDRNMFPILNVAYIPDYLVGKIQWGKETKQHSLHNTGMLQIILQFYLPKWWKENVESRNEDWFNVDLNYKNILDDIVDLKRQALGVMDYFIDGMPFMIWNALFGAARNTFTLEKLDSMRTDHLKTRLNELKEKLHSGDKEPSASVSADIRQVARTICQRYGYLSQSLDELYNDETGVSPLMHTASSGDATLVGYLIDAGVEVNIRDSSAKYTALVHAARSGQEQAVKLLCEQGGADVSLGSDDNMTAIMVAAQQGHLPVVKYLAQETTADPDNKTVQTKQTALHLAAQSGHADVVSFLIRECHVDVSAGVKIGEQPTEVAMAMLPDEFKNCQFILETGFELQQGGESVNRYMQKMMQQNAGEGGNNGYQYKQGDKLAVDFKSDVINLDDKREQVIVENPTTRLLVEYQKDATPLMFAAENGHMEAAKVLIEQGNVDPNSPAGPQKITALLIAAAKCHANVVEYLIKQGGADIDQPKLEGSTALLHAVKGQSLDVVKLLAENGADVNKANYGKWTALMLASFQGALEMVKILMEHGASVDEESAEGVTALACAANGKQLKVVEYLVLEAQANVQHVDSKGRSILDYASASDDIVQFLTEKGGMELPPPQDEDPNIPYVVQISSTSGVWNAFETSFMNSISFGSVESLRPLIQMAGKDVVHAICDDGRTALMLAARSCNLGIVKFLVEVGDCDWTMKDKLGRTALDHARLVKSNGNTLLLAQGVGSGNIDDVIAYLEDRPAQYTGSFDISKKQMGGMAFDIEYSQRQQQALQQTPTIPYPTADG